MFARTAKEYASRTSVHGIAYVFDKEHGFVNRFLWLMVVLAFLGLATYLTWNTWTQWREEQVDNNCVFGISDLYSSVSQVFSAHTCTIHWILPTKTVNKGLFSF